MRVNTTNSSITAKANPDVEVLGRNLNILGKRFCSISAFLSRKILIPTISSKSWKINRIGKAKANVLIVANVNCDKIKEKFLIFGIFSSATQKHFAKIDYICTYKRGQERLTSRLYAEP